MSAHGVHLPTAAAVSIRGLLCKFDDLIAIRDLTMDIAPGELFGIVGPDGAGKTTTLRILAGVLPPTDGDALLAGVSVAREPERVKPHIAYMAQRFGLYEDLTVRENIDFYADLYRVPRADRPARLERLWKFSRLEPFQNRLVGHLSGGMKQKASLCCALIHHPAILLLDEPTFGVDPISRRDLWLILHEMAASGMTIVLTTSYLDEAERCDRVALIDHGSILAIGRPADLQRDFAGPLLEAPFEGDRQLRFEIARVAGVRRVVPFGNTVHITLESSANMQAVRAGLGGIGLRVAEIRTIQPTLEDIFLERVSAGVTHG